MSTLYIAWQAPGPSRSWFPVGRLDAEAAQSEYVFRYTRGALSAQGSGFSPLQSFPDLETRYESTELFPLFKNRVLDSHRKDFDDYIYWLALDKEHADPIQILSLSGGERQTDSLEVFPRIIKNADNSFSCRFFLHGVRHLGQQERMRVSELREGESLQISLELNNPTGQLAVQLQSNDYKMLGWAPRYLVKDIIEAMKSYPKLSAIVVRNNVDSAPIAKQLLIELSGILPVDVEPMSGLDFETLI